MTPGLLSQLSPAMTLAQATVTVPWTTMLLAVLFLLVCVIMILTVLIQRPQGGGLSGAFGSGGGGSGQTAFGARTGDALTIATVGIFVVYLGVAVILNYKAKPETARTTGTTLVDPAAAEQADAPAPEGVSEVVDQSSGAAGAGSADGEGDSATDPAPESDTPASDTPASDTPAGNTTTGG